MTFDRTRMTRHRLANRVQAVALVGAISLILVLCAHALAGRSGIIVSLGFVVAAMAMAPRAAPAMVLRLFRAAPMSPGRWPSLYDTVLALSSASGLTHPPHLFWVPSREIAAFSLGGREAPAIAVSVGALEVLSPRELTGVLAHEIAHIASGDVVLLTLTEVMGRFARSLATFGLIFMLMLTFAGEAAAPLATILFLALAPFAVSLLQLALSRNREYDADAAAVELTGDPTGLASALRTIELQRGSLWRRLLWPYVPSDQPALLRTHPHSEDRIARLLEGHVPR